MRTIIITAIFSILSVSVQAQLTLEQCQSLAKEHYPALQQYDLISNTEDYTISNAARSWIPRINFSAQATLQTDVPTFPEPFEKMMEMQGVEMPGMRKDQYKIGLDLKQNIWDGGASKANTKYAKAEAAEQRSTLDTEMYKIAERINNLFLGILLFEDKITLTQKKIELLKANFKLIKSHQANGIAMPSDVDAVEVEILMTQQYMEQMDASKSSYKTLLEIFIGEAIENRKLERPSSEIEIPTNSMLRPEIAMFQAKRDKLTAQEDLIKSSSMPRFQLFAQAFYGYPGLDFFANMLNSDWTLNAIAGVGMSWNFGEYYTQKNNLSKVRTAAKIVKVQEDVFMFHSKMEQTQESAEITRLRKAIVLDDRIVELQKSVRQAYESKHRNGVINTTELLQKITEEYTANISRSAHEVELLQAIYNLKFTTNQ